MGEKRTHSTHMPRCKSRGMTDWIECSCGWISAPFWDGMEWAMDQWKQHQTDMGIR